jgi:membrane protein
LAVLLVWVYYSSQIILLGAEFTRVSTLKRGARIEPSPHAVRIEQAAAAVTPARVQAATPEPARFR